ncbi:MAG: hypothetical protein U0228_24880 [Myxococcaceae bacterium]
MRGLLLVVAAVSMVACVRRLPTLPPERRLELGGKALTWRPWDEVGTGLCLLDPTRFTNEQQALSTFVAEWLGQTSAPAEGAWDEEHVALLEKGVEVLSGPLTSQRGALEQARACAWTGLATAAEFNAQGLRRVEEGPWLATQVKARLALQRWKDERPTKEASAKDSACKSKSAAPVIYFAAEDERAGIEWLFCDGAKVVAAPGNPPSLQAPPPPAKKPKKEPDPKTWLDAAAKYPGESVSRAPKLPRKKLSRDDGAPEPEDSP